MAKKVVYNLLPFPPTGEGVFVYTGQAGIDPQEQEMLCRQYGLTYKSEVPLSRFVEQPAIHSIHEGLAFTAVLLYVSFSLVVLTFGDSLRHRKGDTQNTNHKEK